MAELPDREKLVNREYKRRDLQAFARTAGIRANARNDELYTELLAWLEGRSGQVDPSPPAVPPMNDVAPVVGQARESISEEDTRKTLDLSIPPRQDHPDVPYTEFAGKVAKMVGPFLPDSQFDRQGRFSLSGVPPLPNSNRSSVDRPSLDRNVMLANPFDASTLSDVSRVSEARPSEVRNNESCFFQIAGQTSPFPQPGGESSMFSRLSEDGKTPAQALLIQTAEESPEEKRLREYRNLVGLINQHYNSVRSRVRRQYEERLRQFLRLARVEVIQVPVQLRNAKEAELKSGTLSLSTKNNASQQLRMTVSALKKLAKKERDDAAGAH
ncbi:hypothetical protein GMRT_15163 [Giardia muris]|uniref:Uncharacterized protein n=1 Tax=Giardia muris TaxID=5742 RepID=A0A4Z1T6D9_GIAMU|nr:hypothetical protein GMRT_15163 [Giardia muris]|eukprot:TNJ28099.1 hypothetical protein GMRT_15163 [Giardia muris]